MTFSSILSINYKKIDCNDELYISVKYISINPDGAKGISHKGLESIIIFSNLFLFFQMFYGVKFLIDKFDELCHVFYYRFLIMTTFTRHP